MKTLAIIGARLNSSRLPGKHLLPLAGQPLITRLVSRLKQSKLIDKIVLATTSDSFNQPLLKWAESNIPVLAFDGDVNDLVGRIDTVVKNHSPKFIVYICGDSPLIDPGFIDHALTHLMNAPQKDAIKLKDSIQTIHEGVSFYSYAGWQKLVSISQCEMSREHVGYGDKLKPILDRLEINDSGDFSGVKHRISVDTAADYKFMNTIYERWYEKNTNDTIVELQWVMKQLIADQKLISINNHVLQKEPDVKYQRISIYCHVSDKIGMGHLKRCSQVSLSLRERTGFGTQLFIIGHQTLLPWLPDNAIWFDTEELLFKHMQRDTNPLWIIDFHPDFINISTLIAICKDKQTTNDVKLIALDKLSPLLEVVDHLYVPSFFSKIRHPKLSFGWQNYLFEQSPKENKKRQVLILTGGSDALGYGATLPRTLEKSIPNSVPIIWVQGPFAAEPVIPQSKRWTVHKNPESVTRLIQESEIVVTCYGLSLFESIINSSLTILLPTKELCDAQELTALIESQTCIVCKEMEHLPDKLTKIFTSNGGFAQQSNAQKIIGRVEGLRIISDKVVELLSNSTERNR